MTGDVRRIAFGPVPSRRLGQSIGINNIPPKICSYSCIYCQLGRTHTLQITRTPFYTSQEIVTAVKQKIQGAKEKKEAIDYLTFVADGEPTLDSNLGEEIELLKTLGIKIAVITNSSLIWKKDVRDDLRKSDWVSLKIDTVDQEIWHRINRPYGSLQLRDILDGMSEFSHSFSGDLVTETMVLQDVNDNTEGLEKVAEFIVGLSPKKSYISIPIRPPAEKWVKSAGENEVNRAFQIFKEQGIEAECLIGYEGNAFAYTGNVEEDILSITSVHPMKEEAIIAFLKKADSSWNVIKKLIREKKLVEIKYTDNKFYIRKLPKKMS
jgi:wyosine [tRNA(Phe)-imidazoG37] synthetase (radical SAM superfamily)